VEACWEDALLALEGASGRLKQAGADGLPLLGEILAERAQAVSRVAALVNSGGRLNAEGIDRLERALAAGAEAAHNLRLLRSLAQAQLARAQQEGFIVRAMGGGEAPPASLVDQRG
jgi:hypothetical protein